MAEPAQGVESAVELAGYEPELKRTLGSFQMFAISFAFISVAVGIFATYDVVLQTGGPVSIWLWVLAAVGQVLVALVYAQFAARIPLSGSSYQWGSRLANPKIGFGLGWLTVCYLAIGVVATDDALAKTAFMPLFNIRPNELTALDHARGVAHRGRGRGGLDPPRQHDQLERGGARVGDRPWVLDRAHHCRSCHGTRFRGEPRLSGGRPEIRLLRHRWRADGRDDPGPCYSRRLRLGGEPG